MIIPIALLFWATTTSPISPEIASTSPVEPPSVERLLHDTFGENPTVLATMKAIAGCESGHRQHNHDGDVIRNPKTPDYGYFQINAPTWEEDAKLLGYDFHTLEGNIKMAKHILEVQGLGAWNPSRACWSPLVAKL